MFYNTDNKNKAIWYFIGWIRIPCPCSRRGRSTFKGVDEIRCEKLERTRELELRSSPWYMQPIRLRRCIHDRCWWKRKSAFSRPNFWNQTAFAYQRNIICRKEIRDLWRLKNIQTWESIKHVEGNVSWADTMVTCR